MITPSVINTCQGQLCVTDSVPPTILRPISLGRKKGLPHSDLLGSRAGLNGGAIVVEGPLYFKDNLQKIINNQLSLCMSDRKYRCQYLKQFGL